jgi:hypothetical protein
MDDASPLAEDSSPAEPHETAAGAASLAGCQDATAAAADRARRTLERVSIRRDIATAQV